LHFQLFHWNLFFDPCWMTHKILNFCHVQTWIHLFDNGTMHPFLQLWDFFIFLWRYNCFPWEDYKLFLKEISKKKFLCFCTLLSYKLPSSSLLCKEPCKLLHNVLDIHYGWKIIEQFMPQREKWMMDEIHTFWMKRLIWINFFHEMKRYWSMNFTYNG